MSRYKEDNQSLFSILLSSHLHRYKQIALVMIAFLAVMIEGYLLPALTLVSPSLLTVIIILTLYRLKVNLWPGVLVLALLLGLVLDVSSLEPIGINMIVALVVVGMVHFWDRVGFLAPQLARLVVIVLTIILVETVIRTSVLYLNGSLFFDLTQTIYLVFLRTIFTATLTWILVRFILR